MSQPVLFYSPLCPDTEPFLKVLEPLNLDYERVNITESMTNLKRFLALRDSRTEFDNKRLLNQVGVPVLVTEDTTLIFDEASLLDFYK